MIVFDSAAAPTPPDVAVLRSLAEELEAEGRGAEAELVRRGMDALSRGAQDRPPAGTSRGALAVQLMARGRDDAA